jgi:glucosamine--fructose-6-phosphate aminotransferase (isomerizing)
MNAPAMLRQVESLPALMRDEFDVLDERVRRAIGHHDLLAVRRIVPTGSGDSHFAALAAELAFEQLAQLPTEPMAAMQYGRYGAAYQSKAFPLNPLVIGISAGGHSPRTVEALHAARREGALTAALTAAPDSPVAQSATLQLDARIADFGPCPGVRTYFASLLTLLLLAVRLREVHDIVSQEEANALRRELKGTADVIEATLDACRAPARTLAERLREHKAFMFVGDGPNYGTALYSAAKVSEACGFYSMGQESEEWKHLQYYITAFPDMPTFFLSPGGRGHDRVAGLMEPARRIGRIIAAVVPHDDTAIAPHADTVLPVVGAVREAFTPLVYCVPGALFAATLCEVTGSSPFNGFQGRYAL